MSSMKTSHTSEQGSAALVLTLVVSVILLIGALVFGFWAYSGRQDYKNNVDQKVNVAVAEAEQATSLKKDKQFAEESKSPLRTYVGPAAFGSIHVQYPKTWSAYVIANSDNTPYVDGYFAPGAVPDTSNQDSVYALRVRVSGDSYSDIMSQYQSNVQNHVSKVVPYRLPKVSSVVGSKITGQLVDGNKQGTLIVVPLRANALEIWTQSDKYLSDFNKYILPNLSFSP